MLVPESPRGEQRSFPIDQSTREQAVKVCLEVMADAKATRRTRIQAVRALSLLDALQQRDQHHVERMKHEDGILDLRMRRAEEGKPNDSVAIVSPPVRRMAAPAWMEEELRKSRGQG